MASHQKINYGANGSLLKACVKAPCEGQKSHPYRDSSWVLTLAALSSLLFLEFSQILMAAFLHQLMWRESVCLAFSGGSSLAA